MAENSLDRAVLNKARLGASSKKTPKGFLPGLIKNLPTSLSARDVAQAESLSAVTNASRAIRRMGANGESTLEQLKKVRSPAGAKLPDPERALKGLTITRILSKQPAYIRASSEDVVVREYKPTKTKGGLPAIAGKTRDLKTKPIRLHKFSVIGLEKEKTLSAQKRVKISCDCEFFLYYCEFALWTWGAANIVYSNGDPAVVKNPGNAILACKHIAKVLLTIKSRGD